jgi:hypothetical protein
MISSYTLQAQQKKLNFSVNVATSLPAHLLGDPLRINQVLLNLCSNAVKFTDVGDIKVNISFRETAAATGLLTIGVVDSGIGMSEQQQGHVFDSFAQADGSTSRKFGGTGLGLAIVKQLVELMGGSIDVSSTKGQGSEFLLSLPVGTTGTERALRPVSANIIETHYLADAGGALLENTLLSDCGLRVTRSSRQWLGALLQCPLEKTAAAKPMILIDLANQGVVEGLREILSALTLAGYPVGCVTQMQSLGLNGGCPCCATHFHRRSYRIFLPKCGVCRVLRRERPLMRRLGTCPWAHSSLAMCWLWKTTKLTSWLLVPSCLIWD